MLFLIALSSLFVVSVGGHECAHHKVAPTVQIGHHTVHSNKATTAPIRMTFNVDTTKACTSVGEVLSTYDLSCQQTTSYTCTEDDILTSEMITYMATLQAWVTSFIQSVVQVSPASSITVAQSTCCWATVTQQTFTNTDLVLWVNFMPSPLYSSVAGFASPCALDQSTHRPIAGFINLNPRSFNVSDFDADKMIYLHELTHVLGFSQTVFNYFPNNIGTRVKSDGRTVLQVTSPSVVAAVQSQFNCSSATGAELEDWEIETSSPYPSPFPSHWEKAIFYNEYMTSDIDQNGPAASILTFSTLKDFGFYTIDLANAMFDHAGYGLGCSFLNDRCDSFPFPYFCSAAGFGCTLDRLVIGFCDIMTYSGSFLVNGYTVASALPSYFQYFGNSVTGGSNGYANFCPFINGFNNLECTQTWNGGQPSNLGGLMGNVFASASRCIASDSLSASFVASGGYLTGDSGYRCFNMTCTSTALQVTIGSPGNVINCPVAGGNVDIYSALSLLKPNCVNTGSNCAAFSGTLTCPSYASACVGPNAFVSNFAATSAISPSVAVTITPSPTPSSTLTHSGTPTPSVSVTMSPTSSLTQSRTPSSSVSVTPTHSPTSSGSLTLSGSPTTSTSPTTSSTPSTSSTLTKSPTSTSTPSSSSTISRTPAISITPTTSPTSTSTPSSSSTISRTPAVSITPTTSPTSTSTPSSSSTISRTPTVSITPTTSPTSTSTPSSSSTISRTPTVSITPTASPTATPTASSSSTTSRTLIVSFSPTNSPTVTPTHTPASAISPSHSLTSSSVVSTLPTCPTASTVPLNYLKMLQSVGTGVCTKVSS